VFPLWVHKNSSSRLKYLAELEQSQYWTRDRLDEHQLVMFQRLFAHAFETCPYYRAKYEAAGLKPSDIRSKKDIGRVPPISKQEIQENREALVSNRYSRDALIRDMTGGSTGSPMQFYYDADRHDSREAATIRHDRWSGWNIGERRAVLWGAPQDLRLAGGWKSRAREVLIDRRIILDASSLDDSSMDLFRRELASFKPTIVQAYANTLALFARYLQDHGGTPVALKGIITSAEVLTPENRQLIERVFSCPVYNRYGSREVSVIASECEMHQGMHVNAENLLVEVICNGQSAIDQDGEIVITDLSNLAMPLLRYRIEDVGRMLSKECSCRRGLPLMELSGGRVTDFLVATSGSKVSGIVIATYVITNIPGVRQIQFVQSAIGTVTVNLVTGPAWAPQSLDMLKQRVRKFLGEDMHIRIVMLDKIPAEASGKFRFSISRL